MTFLLITKTFFLFFSQPYYAKTAFRIFFKAPNAFQQRKMPNIAIKKEKWPTLVCLISRSCSYLTLQLFILFFFLFSFNFVFMIDNRLFEFVYRVINIFTHQLIIKMYCYFFYLLRQTLFPTLWIMFYINTLNNNKSIGKYIDRNKKKHTIFIQI